MVREMAKSSTGKVKKVKVASDDVAKVKPVTAKKQSQAAKKMETAKQMMKTPWSKAKIRLYKIGISVAILVVFAIPVCGVIVRTVGKTAEYQVFQGEQGDFYETAKADFAKLYSDVDAEVPVEGVSEEQIAELEKLLNRIKYKEYIEAKDQMLAKLETLRAFLPVRDEVLAVFDGEVMKSEVETAKIAELKAKVEELNENQRTVLEKRIAALETQRAAIDELRAAVASLFADGSKNTVRSNITQAQYNAVAEKYEAVLQADVKSEQQPYLEKAKAEVDRKVAEERRIAEEERRKREAAVAAAWKTLNVPYISQNRQAIYNGCESASLLMGLQFKGYLLGMSLRQYVEMLPKSDDPNQGFVGSVYDLEPKTFVHWIAPAPLAKFGRETSGANIQDITGASLDQLKNEVLSGNPVVIYLTFQYNAPGGWLNGAPKNLHVMLLTGYNSLTDEFQTTDPWTGAGGKTKYTLPRRQIESIFNNTGKRAVVIR